MRAAQTLPLVVIALLCSSCGPRMRQQQSLQPYSRQLPPMPANVVSNKGSLATILRKQSALPRNPLSPTRVNLDNGRIYYGYYCLMCHGKNGDGRGAVGVAYVPAASDLRSARVAALSDGRLYRAMLTGPGHDPVMQGTVFPDQRWQIVLYVRTFSARGR